LGVKGEDDASSAKSKKPSGAVGCGTGLGFVALLAWLATSNGSSSKNESGKGSLLVVGVGSEGENILMTRQKINKLNQVKVINTNMMHYAILSYSLKASIVWTACRLESPSVSLRSSWPLISSLIWPCPELEVPQTKDLT
jgi:hypothetical protein